MNRCSKKKILIRNEAAAAGPRSLVERARAWLTFDRFASPDRIGVTSGGLSTRDEEGSGIPFSLRPRLIIPRQTKAQNILVSIEEGGKGDPGRPTMAYVERGNPISEGIVQSLRSVLGIAYLSSVLWVRLPVRSVNRFV